MFTRDQLQRASTGGLLGLSLLLVVMIVLMTAFSAYAAVVHGDWLKLIWLVPGSVFSVSVFRMQQELARRRSRTK